MDQLLLILGGVLVSLAFIALVRWLYPEHELTLYGIALIPTAAAYIFFALINGALSSLPREFAGVLLYGGLGLGGAWRFPVLTLANTSTAMQRDVPRALSSQGARPACVSNRGAFSERELRERARWGSRRADGA